MLNFLSKISKNYPALARTLEISILGALFDALIAVGDLVLAYLNDGSTFDRKIILTLFITTTMTGVVAGLQKYLRDRKAEMEVE